MLLYVMEFGLESYLCLRVRHYLIFSLDIRIDAIFSFLNHPESGLGVDYRSRKIHCWMRKSQHNV